MSFPVTVIQTLSATVIFVVGYLALFAAVIFMLVLASCIYKCARLTNAYRARYRVSVAEHTLPHGAAFISRELR